MFRRGLPLPLAALLFGWLALAPVEASPDKIKILTTTLPVFALASSIARDEAEVENLVPSGVEPHDYQITSRDLRKIHQAGLVLINGLHLEDWMNRYLADASTQKKVFPVSNGFENELIHGPTPLLGSVSRGNDLLPNPHFWLDPVLARRAAANILHILEKADPNHAAAYAANAARYDAELQALDADYSRELAPLRDKPFITSHDFFPYLARRYHLRLGGVVELIPEVNPSLHYIEELAAMIRREKVQTLFVEPLFSSKLANQLCRDLGVRRLELDPIETGPPTASAYVDAMRRNLNHLKEGLGGAIP